MAAKRGDMRTRIVASLAAAVAGFCARKVITFAWTRVTGKRPPDDPHDPQVAIAEAVGYAVVMGVGMELARLLATRAAIKQLAEPAAQSGDG